jgi:hypothetical protein
LRDEKHRQSLEEPFAWQFPAQGQGVQAMSPLRLALLSTEQTECVELEEHQRSELQPVPLCGSAAAARGFLGFPGLFRPR